MPTSAYLVRLSSTKTTTYRLKQVLAHSSFVLRYPFVSLPRSFFIDARIFFLSPLAPSVTIKAIGLFLKNSALQSRVSSCSSRSSKSTGANVIDASVPSPPLKHYPSVVHSNPARTTMINYHSQGHLPTSTATRQTFLHPTSVSPHRLTPSKVQHTSTSNGHG